MAERDITLSMIDEVVEESVGPKPPKVPPGASPAVGPKPPSPPPINPPKPVDPK